MSIHPTLRGVDTLKGERSVLTRQERLAQLKKAGKFEEAKRSVYGLPKVRTKFKVAGAKKKAAKEAVPGAPGATAPGAAAPAAGAKGAAAGAKAPAAGAKAAGGAKAAAAPAAGKKPDKK
jgi:small basic protein (TIGR04137 family)